MDKYHEIDKWASEICGSQHDGECCENCSQKNECENHLLNYALWCMFWPDYNEETDGAVVE